MNNFFVFTYLLSSIGVYSTPIKPAVYLTPLIESDCIDEARLQSRVGNLPNAPQIESYSGYLTVNKETGNHLFFWFFPSKNTSAPVGLWLQGGPGDPSTYGLFNENGPFKVDVNLNVTIRKYSWTNLFSYLYIDQPVGAGYSYTENDAYAKNQTKVADDLYQALVQFFKLFPEWKPNDFYLTGESYAGKYVPAIGNKLHQEKESSGINLKGIAMVNPFTFGGLHFRYADLLQQIGVFDNHTAAQARAIEKQVQAAVAEERWSDCYKLQYPYLGGDSANSFFRNTTGMSNVYNYLTTVTPKDTFYSDSYLALKGVKDAIHVGDRIPNNRTYGTGMNVLLNFKLDICPSASHLLENLMDNGYRVLILSGNLDIFVGTAVTEELIRTLKWKRAKGYEQAPRKIWRLEGEPVEVAGYITSYENFQFVVVRNAGHMVPHDQPKVAYELMKKFLYGNL